jgi:mRNA-degrading endonuclease RelE of RelBE toxin-antitoxin system
MMQFELSAVLKETLVKLGKKNPSIVLALRKKIGQIVTLSPKEISHFKNLKGAMSDLKRVHIGPFVLTFRLRGDTIYFEDFEHHDNIYRR